MTPVTWVVSYFKATLRNSFSPAFFMLKYFLLQVITVVTFESRFAAVATVPEDAGVAPVAPLQMPAATG